MQLLPDVLSISVAADVPTLRALAGAANQYAACSYDGNNWGLYLWSTAPQADDGVYWIGSWHLIGTLTVGSTADLVGYAVVSQPWDGSKTVVSMGKDWQIISADQTHVYFARKIDLA